MVASQEMRARVERLLRGEFRGEDISTLFLFLRHRCRGRATVIEIGDFFAHREEKNKGVVTTELKDFFAVMRVISPMPKVAIDSRNLPLNFAEFLWASFRLLDSKTIARDTGLKRQRVEKMLPRMVGTLEPNSTGMLMMRTLRPEEIRVFNCLTRYIVVKPAFSEHRLVSEFIDALVDEQVLRNEERRDIGKLCDLISLTALSSMHLTRIALGDGSHAELTLAPNDGLESVLCALAVAPIFNALEQFVVRSIYTTTLRPNDYCESALLEDAGSWAYPLELTGNKKLGRMS